MPTSRKRIGFLPSAAVQDIIDKICVINNLSQSKVTGILVEEALFARNLYRLGNNNKENDFKINDRFYKTNITDKKDSITNLNVNNLAEDDELNLIKEYLNYKNFKRILSIVQSDS